MSRRTIRRITIALVAAPLVLLGSAGAADAGVSWDLKPPTGTTVPTKVVPPTTSYGVSWD